MSDATAITPEDVPDAEPVRRRRGKGLLVGLVLALALGGGGFWAVYSGVIDPAALKPGKSDHAEAAHPADIAFVPLEPIMISLAPGAAARHLRFGAELEVAPGHAGEVTQVMPRILDVLNTYLRAVDVRDLEAPASVPRLRAQMLRRIQVVTGEGRVRDLLITEFVLN